MPRKSALLLSLLNVVFKPVSGQTKALSNQVVALPQQPLPTDREAWHAYWNAQGQPWRTEPEIDTRRQKELNTCRATVRDIEKSIYPFKGMKLSRADVEWLLATHENERGPVDWSDQHQRKRYGIDLRGADLRQVDLRELPLARIQGGLHWGEWRSASLAQRAAAAILLERADLHGAHLEGAWLRGAHLEESLLRYALLEHAQLFQAHLEGADFFNEAGDNIKDGVI